ncbi:MAG: M48 family metallopeptidase [bacterium]
MEKEIKLDNRSVKYTLRLNPRAKRMRITIHCDGRVILTRPAGTTDNAIENFISENSHWLLSGLESFKKVSLFGGNPNEYLASKQEAFNFIEEKINNFNRFYNFRYHKITIKNQKTRWGSCSKKGNLNFNYRIMFLPERIADYIIVHELCHLNEFNHSRKFWGLVVQTIPDYSELRKKLKQKKF